MRVLTQRILPKEAKAVKQQLAAISSRIEAGDSLNLGDTGKAVSALQRRLAAAGLYSGQVNGSFDSATVDAVAALQKAKGIQISGMVAGKTLKALESTVRFVKDGFEQVARPGERGTDLLRAERMLEKLGFRPGPADGTFDQGTLATVERYRKADPQVPDQGRWIGDKFFSELSRASRGYDHAPFSKREVGGLKQHARLDALTRKEAARGAGIGPGSKGRAVLNVEKHLEAAGFELGSPNTGFGSRTAAAIKAFQKSAGLEQTGTVDERTWSKLQSKLFAAQTATSPAQKRFERGAAVKRTEQKLKKLGLQPGQVDGTFDAATERAVRKFQRKHKLNVTGAVGSSTMRALNKAVKAESLDNLPRTGNAFVDKYAKSAIESQRKTGVPASVTMAQAILESGWGKSGLTQRANNFFGIKGKGPAGSVTVLTREVINGQSVMVRAAFRKYHNAQESFTDHGKFLKDNSRYNRAFRFKNDPAQFARELQRAGYATDPNYANLLISLMRQNHLTRFDKFA